MNEQDPEQLRLLCIAMINSAYELNSVIPNIELVFAKLFFAPISTKEQRKNAEDVLEGNLFLQDGLDLSPQVYKSLLETLMIMPKKKSLKKIIQHMIRHQEPGKITPELISMIV